MFRRSLFFAVLAVTVQAGGQDAPAPAAPAAAAPPAPAATTAPAAVAAAALSKEDILGASIGEPISMPTPSELFVALGKKGKPDWTAFIRKGATTSFVNRAQLSLNLGSLIADGYLAVEAQDAPLVRNIARDIMALCKGLGVQKQLQDRANNLLEFADSGNWEPLLEELESVQNEVTDAMEANQDKDYVILVLLGGWLRGTEVVTSYLSKNYTPEGARVLRQPAVVDHFVQKLAKMPKKIIDTDLMTEVRTTLFDISKAVSHGHETTPSEEEVKKLNALAAGVLKKISTK